MEERAKELRAQGLTYREISKRLGVKTQKAWILANREVQRRNTNESVQRYEDRGRVPLWQGDEV